MAKTIPSDIRKEAKRLARAGGISHQSALDRLARERGHANWSAALQAAGSREVISPLAELVERAWNAYATDIHIEPDAKGSRILFRIHGKRTVVERIGSERHDAMMTEIVPFLKSGMRTVLADGETTMRIGGDDLKVLIATIPADGSKAKIVFRIPDRYTAKRTIGDLGIEDLDGWLALCRSGPGIIIVSGSTSSGKTTTIARTVFLMRRDGYDVVAETSPTTIDHQRIGEIIGKAGKSTVILEAHGTSLDRAIANLMMMGFPNAALSRLFLGGMHQKLEIMPVGPRMLTTGILPWTRDARA